MAEPSPHDRLREDEMAIVPFLELQVAEEFRPARDRAAAPGAGRQHTPGRRAGGRVVDHRGDRARRSPQGKGPEEIGSAELTDRISPLAEQTVLAMYHAHQARTGRPTSSRGSRYVMAKRDPQPPRATPGDVLPRHHRLHATDPGTRRRRGRRAGDDGRAAGPSAAPSSTAASPSSGSATA